MGDERLERRGVLGAGVGLLVALAGCGGLFVEEKTPRPGTGGGSGGGGSTPTSTPAPTVPPSSKDTPTATRTHTPTPTLVPSTVFEVRNRRLTLRESELGKYTFVYYWFEVENVGSKTIDFIDFKVDVRYDFEDVSRLVATKNHRAEFDYPGDEDGNEDAREGLQQDEEDLVSGRLRYDQDGRADESLDDSRFELELTVRRVKYL